MSSSHSQNWDPARYRANARFVSELGMPVVELLSPQPAPSERQEFVSEVVGALRAVVCDTNEWRADYVRLRFSAIKPNSAT
jgi:hypothetical protein